ncbi:unnamed protein product [Parnassius mnemosyne]|uniref:Uncharacterized protein n=1 Tax=Parnassius mnemosyne TaxID=213953 RepID=A0AAV1M1V5_9NEOP
MVKIAPFFFSGKCLRIPASRGQGRVMSDSHQLKRQPHGSPFSGENLSSPFSFSGNSHQEHKARPPPRLPTPPAYRNSPSPIRGGHGARKIERLVAPAFPTPAADLVSGSAANQVSTAEGRESGAS